MDICLFDNMNPMERDDAFLEAACRLHADSVVLDSHCDTTMRLGQPGWDFSARHTDGHVDIPRLREGGIAAVVLAIYASGPLDPGEGPKAARQQFDVIERTIASHPGELVLARTAADVRAAKTQGRIAILVGVEGGYLIDDSLDILREFHQRGAIYLTLTHSFHTSWADSSGVHADLSPLHGGLTDFGRQVICELNRLGMLVDVSHVSDQTFWDVMETSRGPVIASHSSCRAVSPHRRNLSDEMIRATAEKRGVVQINFAAAFVDPDFPSVDQAVLDYWSTRGGFAASPYARHVTPLSVLADHFDHAIKLVGADHVGIGSDFDGVGALPRGMGDCSKLPYLTAELLRRGHREEDLKKVLGLNFLRVLNECQEVALHDQSKSAAATPCFDFIRIRANRCRFILASASPRRAELLRQQGIDFEVIPAAEEEPPVPQVHLDPATWAEQVALQKARSVAKTVGRGLILGGDTIAVLGDRVIGKPADRAHAEAILRSLMGTRHQVITALVLLDAESNRCLVRHDVTHVHMCRLSRSELEKYLDSREWEGKAGAYGIQDRGDKFVERIEGSFTNVVGLPVELLSQMLTDWF